MNLFTALDLLSPGEQITNGEGTVVLSKQTFMTHEPNFNGEWQPIELKSDVICTLINGEWVNYFPLSDDKKDDSWQLVKPASLVKARSDTDKQWQETPDSQ